MMDEDNFLFEFLERDIEEAKKEIKAGNGLTQKGATAMLLKGMYNHIAHLDQSMVTKSEFMSAINGLERKFGGEFDGLKSQFDGLKSQFDGLKSQFDGLKSQFSFMQWVIGLGFAVIAILITVMPFIKS